MKDRIELRGLRVLGTHGVLAEERERAQPFEIDLDVEADLGPAARADDLAQAVDYGAMADRVVEVAEGRSFRLLEALADAVGAAVLEDPRVNAVTVTVRKLRPPVPVDLASAGVRLTRQRDWDSDGG
ncbi:MAG: dihydroneopterin aldolase [Acidimicrobiaceae bacterium]|nr:dihydroneopterin aldolase [Acidimicrobiaceae bacterium]